MGMKKCMLFLLLACMFLSGCAVEKADDKKQKDIEFTVTDQEDIPEGLKTQIEENKEKPFKLTYGENGYLYLAQGYGKQATSGYSIEVAEVYETKNAIYMKTNLIGPAKDEEILKKATYPYVVIKIEYNEKHVVFK